MNLLCPFWLFPDIKLLALRTDTIIDDEVVLAPNTTGK
jgi:hypothetical protein